MLSTRPISDKVMSFGTMVTVNGIKIVRSEENTVHFPREQRKCRQLIKCNLEDRSLGDRFFDSRILYDFLTRRQVSGIDGPLLLFIFSNTKKASTVIGTGFQAGDPREIRTPDTLIRSQVLYPAELLGHVAGAEGLKPPTYGFGDRCSINCAMPLSV